MWSSVRRAQKRSPCVRAVDGEESIRTVCSGYWFKGEPLSPLRREKEYQDQHADHGDKYE